MWQIMQKGGPVMVLIGLCSLVAVWVFFERLFHYHRAQIRVDEFMKGIRNVLKRQNIVEAISICEETPGPVAHVLKAAIIKHGTSGEEIREAVSDAGLTEVPRLEKNLTVLATVAHVSPLLGLFGTVLGMIKAFIVVQQRAPIVQPGDLAGGIWESLITTAAGLAVAIPSYVAYNYLVSRVEGLVLDMEKCSAEIVHLLTSSDEDFPR